MPYSEFTTLRKVREQFGITIAEAAFLPAINPVVPSSLLLEFLTRYRPRALDISVIDLSTSIEFAPYLIQSYCGGGEPDRRGLIQCQSLEE